MATKAHNRCGGSHEQHQRNKRHLRPDPEQIAPLCLRQIFNQDIRFPDVIHRCVGVFSMKHLYQIHHREEIRLFSLLRNPKDHKPLCLACRLSAQKNLRNVAQKHLSLPHKLHLFRRLNINIHFTPPFPSVLVSMAGFWESIQAFGQ